MQVDSITLHDVDLTRSDGGRGRALVIQVTSEGHHGWAEAAVGATPWDAREFVDSAWIFAERFAAPQLLRAPLVHPTGIGLRLEQLHGHPRTKMALEMAVWDLYARSCDSHVLDALGGGRENLTFRAKIRIPNTLEELLESAADKVNQGADVLQVVISPGWEVEPISELRAHFPDARIMADASGSFHPTETAVFRQLVPLDVEGIIDPFDEADLDATIELTRSAGSAVWGRAAGWRQVDRAVRSHLAGVVLDADSFGGVGPLLDVTAYCLEHHLETLVDTRGSTLLSAGQAALLAAATGSEPGPLAHFFGRWGRDIVKPGWLPSRAGLDVPAGIGNGLTVDRAYLNRQARRSETIGP